jgi:hypothetical protein
VNQLEEEFLPLARALELRFESGNALEEVFFQTWSDQAIGVPVGLGGTGARYDHQSRSAGGAGLAIVRIRMSASLTEEHLYETDCFVRCPAPGLLFSAGRGG